MTVGSAGSLRLLVTRSDSHPALVPESGAALSYAGLQRALDQAAGRLAALGVREGDRVAIAAANGPALIVAFLAVVASGAVAAPLNPALGEAELTAELEDLRVSRLLHDGVAAAVAAAGRSGVAASVFGMAEGLLHIDGEAARRWTRPAARTRWPFCCIPAARRASRRPCRSGSATWSRRPARSPAPTRWPATT